MTLAANKLNNTGYAEKELLFFNRMEKVGSQSMSRLLNKLSKINNFEPYRNMPVASKAMTDTPAEELEFAEELSALEGASSYVEHANWINFTKYDLPKPIYMNLIRHPIQKVMSGYYYVRHPFIFANGLLRNPAKKMMPKEFFDTPFNDCVRNEMYPECVFDAHNPYNGDWRRFVLHFCGNTKICEQFNSQIATQIAKRNIEKEYAVVGSWEDTNITLTVLEHYIPRFFRGATKLFYSDSEMFHINATPHNKQLDRDIEAKLNIQFAFEIELYNFCKQRLYKQYIAIKKNELMSSYE